MEQKGQFGPEVVGILLAAWFWKVVGVAMQTVLCWIVFHLSGRFSGYEWRPLSVVAQFGIADWFWVLCAVRLVLDEFHDIRNALR